MAQAALTDSFSFYLLSDARQRRLLQFVPVVRSPNVIFWLSLPDKKVLSRDVSEFNSFL